MRRHGNIQASGLPRGQVEGVEPACVLLYRAIQVFERLRLVAGTGLHPAGRPQQEGLQLCRNPPSDATGRPSGSPCFPQSLAHARRRRFARSQDARGGLGQLGEAEVADRHPGLPHMGPSLLLWLCRRLARRTAHAPVVPVRLRQADAQSGGGHQRRPLQSGLPRRPAAHSARSATALRHAVHLHRREQPDGVAMPSRRHQECQLATRTNAYAAARGLYRGLSEILYRRWNARQRHPADRDGGQLCAILLPRRPVFAPAYGHAAGGDGCSGVHGYRRLLRCNPHLLLQALEPLSLCA